MVVIVFRRGVGGVSAGLKASFPGRPPVGSLAAAEFIALNQLGGPSRAAL